jgi:hypothetical protein
VDTTDAQPTGENGGIVVMVTGALMVSCNDIPILCGTGAKSCSKHDQRLMMRSFHRSMINHNR